MNMREGMTTIRWGFIGCGEVTETKSGPGFHKAAESTVTAVMRRNAAKAEDYARRHGVPRWYGDAEALIRDPEVDAVYVATYPDTHHDYVLQVAAAGKPVLVEKPMGLNHAECESMREACQRAGVPLFVSLYRRCLPRFLKVRDLVAQGEIGEPRSATVLVQRPATANDLDENGRNWRLDPAISGGGHFFDLAAHQFDLLDFILGPIEAAHGFANNLLAAYAAEDSVTACWRHASGVLGTGNWCFSAGHSSEYIEIVGSAGRVRFSLFEEAPVECWRGDVVERFSIANPPHVHQPLIESIVAELNGRGTCPSTGESGARAAWVMDRVLGRQDSIRRS